MTTDIPQRTVMVTTSRMPFALDAIRKLGRRGHRVIALDTFAASPGAHSRYAQASIVAPSPRFDPQGFVGAVIDGVQRYDADFLLPCFEEAILLSEAREEVEAEGTDIFTAEPEALWALHDKDAFRELAASLGLDVPVTFTAKNRAELEFALRSFPRHFARQAFSRGGMGILTNHGPLAGTTDARALAPQPDNPVIVQPFLEGEDVCSLSICHVGRVVAHASYLHPKGVAGDEETIFRSIDPKETLPLAQAIAAATNYHGQLSLDCKRTPDGRWVLIECNPRASAGGFFIDDDQFERALFAPRAEVELVPADTERAFSSALLRDIVADPASLGEDLQYILGPSRSQDIDRDDPATGWWQLLSYVKLLELRRHLGLPTKDRTDLMAAYVHDVLNDGPADLGRVETARVA